MKTKRTSSKKAKLSQKGHKGGKSQWVNQRPDFIDEDFINPLESSLQIFSSDLLR